MARFGYLYLNHGLWGQARIVPETWVGESTAMTPNNYGYLWWLFGGGYAAMGDGGNIIFCSPEKDVVIAATASCPLTAAALRRLSWKKSSQWRWPASPGPMTGTLKNLPEPFPYHSIHTDRTDKAYSKLHLPCLIAQ